MNVSATPNTAPPTPVVLPGVETSINAPPEDHEAQTLAAAIELLLQLEPLDNLQTAAVVSGEILRDYMQARRVLIGWRHGSRTTCQILCDTQTSGQEDRDAIARKAEFALDEIVIRGRLTQHGAQPSEASQSRDVGQLAVKQFAESIRAQSLTGAPLLDHHGNLRGAWIVVDSPQSPGERQIPTGYVVDGLSRSLGARFATIERNEPSWLRKTFQDLNVSIGRARTSVLAAVLLLLAFAVFYPVKYNVRCDCILQPVGRRFVATPFDGSLENSLVQPGDVVQENELLARMSARELDWELAGLYAELRRSHKERKVSIANQDYAESQISELEARRIQSQTQLLETRVLNLEIRSPITGVVVSGDNKKLEGAPLKTGQTLFEIAPLGEMIVELLIPEDDYAYVKPDMPVQIRLSAFPTQPIDGIVQRVHPRAEIKEQQNVFVAEMKIEDPHTIYRPGMHGRAGVESVRRPLVWVAFHKPWASLLMWLGL